MLAACVITVHNIGGNVAPFVLCLIMDKQAHFKAYRMWYMCNKVFFFKAMSSYLFIVKSELPLVIQAFLSKTENTG